MAVRLVDVSDECHPVPSEGIDSSKGKGTKMLDSLINKYLGIYAHINELFDSVQETGVIPNADVAGAPKSVDEALYGLASMLFALDQIISDLNIVRMEQNFAESAAEDN